MQQKYSIKYLTSNSIDENQPLLRNFARVLMYSIIIYVTFLKQALTLGWLRHYSWQCEPVDYSWDPIAFQVRFIVCINVRLKNQFAFPLNLQMAKTCHLYFLIKITDLLDTVFFILRKKQSQVTFLHVYHHGSMIFLTWFGCRFYAGGHGTFLGNSPRVTQKSNHTLCANGFLSMQVFTTR